MKASDAVAALRPRPSGPPLRGRATLRDGIRNRRLVGRQNTKQGTAGSTLILPISGLRLGVGATVILSGALPHGILICCLRFNSSIFVVLESIPIFIISLLAFTRSD